MSPLFGRTPEGGTPDEVTVRLNRQHERIAELERELARVSPQLAALEERVAALQVPARVDPDGVLADAAADSPDAGAGSPDATASSPDVAELLEAIRAEHARVRARISAAAKYEERLRQLEEKVARLDTP